MTESSTTISSTREIPRTRPSGGSPIPMPVTWQGPIFSYRIRDCNREIATQKLVRQGTFRVSRDPAGNGDAGKEQHQRRLYVLGRMDRLGFEPRTSCLQSRRSSADLPAPTRAERRGADETFREDSRSRGSTLIRIPEMKGPWVVPRTEPSDGLSGSASWPEASSSWPARFSSGPSVGRSG